MPNDEISAQNQIWYEVQGVPGTWARGGGLKKTRSSIRTVRKGGSKRQYKLGSRPTYEPLALSRPFDPAEDAALLGRFDALVETMAEVTVVKFYGDADLVPYQTESFIGRVTGYMPPDGDADSDEPAQIGLDIEIEARA